MIKETLNYEDKLIFLRKSLPEHYTCVAKLSPPRIVCSSSTGIADESEWQKFVARIMETYGDEIHEIDHVTCTNHVKFIIYLKSKNNKAEEEKSSDSPWQQKEYEIIVSPETYALINTFMGKGMPSNYDGETKVVLSWNDLMPVVEHIEQLKYSTEICVLPYGTGGRPESITWCEIRDDKSPITSLTMVEKIINNDDGIIARSESKIKIEAVCFAIVEFIKWHNKSKTHDKN